MKAARTLVVAWALSSMGCELLIHDVTLDTTTGDRSCDGLRSDGTPRAGPAMVRVDSDFGSYCIDATEVTIEQFNEYIVSSGKAIDEPAACAKNFALPARNPDKSSYERPASGMSVCHAWSFCRWAGKRLCGAIPDGGPVVGLDPGQREWTNACMNGRRATVYPYGDDYDGSICRAAGDGSVDVGSMASCHGTNAPYDRIFDLSGNVMEFVNDFSENATVAVGGSWTGGNGDTCASYVAYNAVGTAFAETGFRCCASL